MKLEKSRSEVILRALAIAGLLGAGSGAVFSPEPVLAGCTEDECESGTRCTSNAGHQTQCDMLGQNECATDSCE